MPTTLSYRQRRLVHHPPVNVIVSMIREALGFRPSGVSDGIDNISFIFTYALDYDDRATINEIMDSWEFEEI